MQHINKNYFLILMPLVFALSVWLEKSSLKNEYFTKMPATLKQLKLFQEEKME